MQNYCYNFKKSLHKIFIPKKISFFKKYFESKFFKIEKIILKIKYI